MGGPRGFGLSLLATGMLLALPATASAATATLCVGTSGGSCTTVEPTLTAAMAAATSGDTVQIGPGTYTATGGPDGVESTQPDITVVGSGEGGATGTTISGSHLSFIELALTGTGSKASNLEVSIPSGSTGDLGADVNGTVTNVAVVAASGTTNPEGVIVGNGDSFSGTVNLSAATGSLSVGISLAAGTVSDTTVTGAPTGIDAGAGNGMHATIEDTRVSGATIADIAQYDGGTLDVTSSLIELGSPCGDGCAGIYVSSSDGNSHEADLTKADQDTFIAGSTSGGTSAGWAVIVGSEQSTESATAEIDSSVAVGFTASLGSTGGSVECYDGNGGAGAVSIGYSSFNFTGMTGAGGSISGSGCPNPTFTDNENQGGANPVAPTFVNAAAGNYDLPYNSPLVDAGDPTLTGGLDLAGNARVVNGKGSSGAAVTDIGAYEYQRLPPSLTASATATASVGEPIDLTSAATDNNDGESISASVWSFDDGTTTAGATSATVATTTHTYKSPGTYHETITVTEPNGLSASKTFTTVVTLLPPVIGTPAFNAAYSSGKGRHKHHVPDQITFMLSESATVSVQLDRIAPGRLKGGMCVAATHARRHLHGCTRLVPAGTTRVEEKPGDVYLRLKKNLPPGKYEATITGQASSGPSTTVSFEFHIDKLRRP